MTFIPSHSKLLGAVIAEVLTPEHMTMVRELVSAEKHGAIAMPEDLLHWMRLNMPTAAQQVIDILHPNE